MLLRSSGSATISRGWSRATREASRNPVGVFLVKLSYSGPWSQYSLINEGSWTGIFLCLVISTKIEHRWCSRNKQGHRSWIIVDRTTNLNTRRNCHSKFEITCYPSAQLSNSQIRKQQKKCLISVRFNNKFVTCVCCFLNFGIILPNIHHIQPKYQIL